MEYPFKDLLPLDEVLEREGYYKDWTHIDANTFHQISELVKFIREKGYGADTREAIAQALERVYHDALISGNANMEVSMARKHFKDLATRLDASDDKLNSATTQLAQKVNKNQGEITSADLSQEVKEQMTGGSVAVVGVNSVLESNVVDKQITPRKTSFMNVSTNLIDTESAVENKGIDSATGEVVETPGTHMVTINVKPGDIYTKANVSRYYLYSSDGSYISSNVNDTYTIPTGVGILRLTYTDEQKPTAQLNEGSVLLPYEPFGDSLKENVRVNLKPNSVTEVNLSDKSVTEEKLNDKSITKIKIADKAVGVKQTDFIKQSTNLIDNKTIIHDQAYSRTTGELVEAIGHNSLPYMDVLPGESYTFTHFDRVFFRDENGEFIRFIFTTTNKTIEIPSDVYQVGFSGPFSVGDKVQLNKGGTLLPYEEYYIEIDDLKIESSQNGNVENTKPYYVSPEPVVGLVTMEVKEYPQLSLSELYDGWERLATDYPEYVTKKLFGNDASGEFPIYQYSIKPPSVDSRLSSPTKRLPKILLQAGIHGAEIPSSMALYNFFKVLCEDWKTNETLEYVRWNAHFEVIPVVSPWGYENLGEGYTNSNGVNIQRNYPEAWVQETPGKYYGGDYPLSEPETQYSKQMIDENQDADLFIDLHSMTPPDYQSLYYAMSPTGEHYDENAHVIFNETIKKMTRAFVKNDVIPNAKPIGFISKAPYDLGAPWVYAESLGITAGVFEFFDKLPEEGAQSYTSESQRLNAETMANLVVTIIQQLRM